MNLDKHINCLIGGALIFGSIGCIKNINKCRYSNQIAVIPSNSSNNCSKLNLVMGLSMAGLSGSLIILRELIK
jgi:hypothetical protein